MALTTCPACGRKEVSTAGSCPNCGVPVSKYLREMPSYKNPVTGDMVKCPDCGTTQKRGRYCSCPKCGRKLSMSTNSYYSGWLNPCPRCGSERVDKVHSEMRQRKGLEALFTLKTSVYWIESFWCHNCGHVFKKQKG